MFKKLFSIKQLFNGKWILHVWCNFWELLFNYYEYIWYKNRFLDCTFKFNIWDICISSLRVAAMHFNENTCRPQAVTSEGVAQYKIQYPKYKKGGYTVTEVKTDPTFGE